MSTIRHIILSLTLGVASCLSALAQTDTVAADATPRARLKLETRTLSFGDIDPDVWHVDSVAFTNTGDAPLVITNLFTSCNCTVPSYPRHPVMPGDTGHIVVKFRESAKAIGAFRKTVRIRSNAVNHSQVLFVEGRISNKVTSPK